LINFEENWNWLWNCVKIIEWAEKVRNYGNWSKILSVLEEEIFGQKNKNLRILIRLWDCIEKRWN
jgi:hypothetical protein